MLEGFRHRNRFELDPVFRIAVFDFELVGIDIDLLPKLDFRPDSLGIGQGNLGFERFIRL